MFDRSAVNDSYLGRSANGTEMFKKLKQRLEDSVDAATSAVTSASGGRINLQKSPESQPKVKLAGGAVRRLRLRLRDGSTRMFTPGGGGLGLLSCCHSFNADLVFLETA